MKRPGWLIACVLLSGSALGQSFLAQNGDCTIGGQETVTQGLLSVGVAPIGTSNVSTGSGVMGSYPECQVTVYDTGTTNLVALYKSNNSGDPLTDPFTANVDGSWLFYVDPGCYDITLSTSSFITLPSTRTLTDVCLNATGGGGGGGTTIIPDLSLQNCTSDQTGNSFYSTTALTNYFDAHWEYVHGQASFTNCIMRIPHGLTGSHTATVILEIAANDATAGHTANFQSCDVIITTGASINVAAPTCATNQAFTTTTTAYARSTLSFAVQSTIAANNLLVIKVATSTTGTQPTANMLVWAYLRID